MTSLFIAPRVPLADPDSGLCNPIWYRFFADMFAAFTAGGGTGGVLQATNGGTGLTNYITGDLIYASSATTLNQLHDVATGNALISGGVGLVPTWGKIGLTTHVSGTLSVPNGGTGDVSLTGYLKGNGVSPFTATTTVPGADISGDIPGNAQNVNGVVLVPNGGSGATTLTGYLKGNGTAAFTASASIPGTDITGAALTKTDDTNVTLTLGGTPATALLRATSLTLGWTGSLAVGRGGTGGTVASGTLLDNITGFAATGMLARTAAGTYAFRTDTGTANRITVTNGNGVAGNPTFDIASTYVGQTSITTLGTITAGTWNGTTVAVANGGTGVTTSTGTVAVVLSTKPQFANTIGVGVAASASGSGVSFPATQSASTDPNTLDDYEEGTWTPTVTATSGTITTYSATGVYTKVGNKVSLTVYLTITNNGTGAGQINATLPFTAGAAGMAGGAGQDLSNGLMLQGRVLNSATVVNILKPDSTYPATSGSLLMMSVTYFV